MNPVAQSFGMSDISFSGGVTKEHNAELGIMFRCYLGPVVGWLRKRHGLFGSVSLHGPLITIDRPVRKSLFVGRLEVDLAVIFRLAGVSE